MAKNVIVTEQTDSGLNQAFKAPGRPEMSRPEFVKQIEKGNFPDYHVLHKDHMKIPRSNPDGKKGNNLN